MSDGESSASKREHGPEVRATILHVSDLHVGRTFDDSLRAQLRHLTREISPDILIVSGDLVNSPWPASMRKAREFVEQLADDAGIPVENRPDRVVTVPGNHDYKILGNFGLRRLTRVPYEVHFGRERSTDGQGNNLGAYLKLSWNALLPWGKKMRDMPDIRQCAEHGVILYGFNSTPLAQRFGLATGKVEDEQIANAAGYIAARRRELDLKRKDLELQRNQSDATIADIEATLEGLDISMERLDASLKIAVVHHHPVPIAYVNVDLQARLQESFMIFFNAGTFLRELGRSGVDVVLHGHKHYTGFSRITYDMPDYVRREMSVLAAGSATHHKPSDPLGNEFNVIRVYDDDTVDAEQWYFSAAAGRKEQSRSYVLVNNDDVRGRRHEHLIRHTGMTCREVTKRFRLTRNGYSAVETRLLGCAAVNPRGVSEYDVDLPSPLQSYIRHFKVNAPAPSPGFLRFEEDANRCHFRHVRGKIVFGETRTIKDGPFNVGCTYHLMNGHALDATEFQRKYLGQDMEWEYATLWCEEPTESLKLTVEFPDDFDQDTIEETGVHVVYEPWKARRGYGRIGGKDLRRHDAETNRVAGGLKSEGHGKFELSVAAPIPGLGYRIRWRYKDEELTGVRREDEERLRYVRQKLIEAAEQSADRPSPLYDDVQRYLRIVQDDVESRYPAGDPDEQLSISLCVLDDRDPKCAALRFVATNVGAIGDLLDETLVPGEGCAGFSFEKQKTLLYDKDRDEVGYYISPEEMAEDRGEPTTLKPHTFLFTVPWVAAGSVPVGVLSIGSTCRFSRLLQVFDLDDESQKREMDRLVDLTGSFGELVLNAVKKERPPAGQG